ncbi:MAG: FAD-dependent oxidoreductase, partial [Deltaproteobacteria bacterium]
GGTLLLNTTEPLSAFAGRYERYRLALVDATAIARKHKIGTRSMVIVNTTIAGAFARALGLPLEALEQAYLHLGFVSNYAAARDAYEAVAVREPVVMPAEAPRAAVALPMVRALVDVLVSPPTGLRTGNWRTQTPKYTHNLAPCTAHCPAGNDAIGFVRAMATANEQVAAEILGRSTPLAGVCGRVCPAPCMEGCSRRELDGSVNIRALERWIADHAPVAVREVTKKADAKRVAIVGGGPAGIAAAYVLVREGHDVTVYDGEPALGGVLRTGIPTYRLPRNVLDGEVDAVLRLGVKTSLGKFLDKASLAALARDYDSVILATGLQRLRGIDGPGQDLAGVEQGIKFLHRVNMTGGVKLAGHVVVLGGGNTAMDCARSAMRLGATRVTVAYRRGLEEMPAIREEIEEAQHEGVEFRYLAQPVGFRGEGAVAGVVLADVELGPADDTGRRRPVVTERHSVLACDMVLLALGQSADLSLLPEGWSIQSGRVHQGEAALNVFAAGDVSTGDGTVAHAIGDGRRAATRALRALGDSVDEFRRPDRALAVPVTDIRLDHFAKAQPTREQLVPMGARLATFVEVSSGLESAIEAHRCFSCGECTQCDTCLVYCPEGIIRRKESGYDVDYSYCKGCGICVVECPRKAMEMVAT